MHLPEIVISDFGNEIEFQSRSELGRNQAGQTSETDWDNQADVFVQLLDEWTPQALFALWIKC